MGGIGIVTVIAIVALSGGGDKKQSVAVPDHATTPDKPSRPKTAGELRLDAANLWWKEQLRDDQDRKRALKTSDLDRILQIGRERGYDKLEGFHWSAKERHLAGLRKAAAIAERVPLTDYPNFWKVAVRFLNAKSLPENLRKFRSRFDGMVDLTKRRDGSRKVPRLSPEAFAEVRRYLDAFLRYREEIKENPRLGLIVDALQRVRHEPVLGQYGAAHITVGPFVLFYASKELVPRGESDAEKQRLSHVRGRLKARLERYRRFIGAFLDFWHRRWIEPLKLQEFTEKDLLYVWIFDDRQSFEEYGKKIRMPIPPFLLGYFNAASRWSFVYEDRKRPERVKTTLAHELTHQLQWHFSKSTGRGPVLNYFKRIEAVWFTEGWAEYVGWTGRRGDGYTFAQVGRPRLDSIHAIRSMDPPAPLLHVRDLVARKSYGEYIRWVRWWLTKKLTIAKENPEVASLLAVAYLEILYAQSWLFVRFLYEGERGKYRDRMMEFTGAALKGFGNERQRETVEAAFARIFRIPLRDKAAWEQLNKEFLRYADTMLSRYPPQDKR